LPTDYGDLLAKIKDVVAGARLQASKAVNTELLKMNWQIGRIILERQAEGGWGASVIPQLAKDLRSAYPGSRGFGARNLGSMRLFATEYPDLNLFLQSVTAKIGWTSVVELLRVPTPERDWYAARAVAGSWSARFLVEQVRHDLFRRTGAAPNNFAERLPSGDAEAALELVQDEYQLNFLQLLPGFSERELEDGLVAKLALFLQQLGKGFAYLGRQYKLTVGEDDFYLDLLFYHAKLHRYVVFELKVGKAQPEFIGKLNFYVQAVEALERDREHDNPTIGILLVTDLNHLVMTYTLQGTDAPIAIGRYSYGDDFEAPYQELPADIAAQLPTPGELHDVLTDHAIEQVEPLSDEGE
jgi:predicted nuclease of restriction endonuclease-like (RecB) superfamily